MKNRNTDNSALRPGRMTLPSRLVGGVETLVAMGGAVEAVGIVEDQNGTAQGILTIKTTEGVIRCTVDQFGDAYKGMVRLWPMVAKVRDTQDKKRKLQAAAARKAARAAAKHVKLNPKGKAKGKAAKAKRVTKTAPVAAAPVAPVATPAAAPVAA